VIVDFFRFLNPTDPMKMEQGILIPHLKSKMWIERYDQAGEFTFVADVKSGVRDLLPIGSFVSHVDTPEIMIVENHEISDKKDTDAEITISGRGFESDFESRIVGSNKVFPTSGAASEYILDAGYLAAQIVISEDTGEITSADYLWSSKKRKNAALITGRWVETRVVGPETNKDRLWMTVDASDIDQNFETEPVGADLAAIVAAMEQRGREALSAQNDVALTKVDVSKNSNNAAYRTDFNVGDLITVLGSYNSSTTMRISEYVEIEDQTGAQSGPTLSLL
jgi:hypothetical protein